MPAAAPPPRSATPHGRVPAGAPVRRAGSLRRTLLAALAALFVLASIVLYFAARGYGVRAADRSYDHLLQSSALSMADSVSFVQGQWQVDLPYAALDLLAMAPQDRAFYRIIAPDGQTITGYGDLPAGGLARPGDAGAGAGGAAPRFFDARYRGAEVRFVQVPRYIAGGLDGDAAAPAAPVWVQVGQTRLARQALADDIVWRAAAVIGALMLAAFALLGTAVHWALRPLARLERELAQREACDLRPVASPVPRELGQVVAALDDFMSRLAVNLDALRTFIAEAAHQMRTPLAALIAQAQDGLDDGDPAHQRRSLQAVERNAMRLRRLVNQLLSDASVSHQGHLRQFQPVDLLQLLREAVRDGVPRADPQPRVDLVCDLPHAAPALRAWARGDALMLREAFKNLIDNALKHGRPAGRPPGGPAVTIRLRRAPGGAAWQIDIGDHGPGVPADRRSAVFDRFVRAAGPGGAADQQGAGLGLSIVRRVIDSHGGQIALQEREDGLPGLNVRLLLPAGKAPGE